MHSRQNALITRHLGSSLRHSIKWTLNNRLFYEKPIRNPFYELNCIRAINAAKDPVVTQVNFSSTEYGVEAEKMHVLRYPGVLVRAVCYKFLSFHYLHQLVY